MSNLDLFGWTPPAAPAKEEREPEVSLESKFQAFHRDNPHVLDELRRLARERVARGQKYISMKALWEELRVSLDRIADGGTGGLDAGRHDQYKLNNNHTALYARMLIAYEPQLADVIQTRKRKGE